MKSDNSQLLAKKSLSQNFLINQQIIDKIAKKMQLFVEQSGVANVVEIGPGEGSLTKSFLEWGKHIIALEIDSRAVELLQQKFSDKLNLTLIQADASSYFSLENKTTLDELKPFVMVSNLPFNIGSRILVDLAITCPDINFSVILQSEVVDKLTQTSNHLTFFGCWIKSFWEIKEIMTIAPCHFRPVPKVYATLIEATSKKITGNWLFNLTSDELLQARTILKSIFSQPRKSLSSHLRLLGLSPEQSELFYKQTNYLPNTRLTWDNYNQLWGDICTFIKK
jgi:16S rRNA (adenine1518-N6/adenine1519-N6)-dimethyltransferase